MGSKKGIMFIMLWIGFVLFMGSMLPSVGEGQPKEPVKIGILTPLSPPGDHASGKWIQWGAELGIKYVNEEMKGVLGGRPVQLVVADDQGVPAE